MPITGHDIHDVGWGRGESCGNQKDKVRQHCHPHDKMPLMHGEGVNLFCKAPLLHSRGWRAPDDFFCRLYSCTSSLLVAQTIILHEVGWAHRH